MLKRVALISCSKRKKAEKSFAKDLYISDSFVRNMEKAECLGFDEIYIISAKHGLLRLDDEVDPYDVNLKEKSEKYVFEWSKGILAELKRSVGISNNHFVIFADPTYSGPLVEQLPKCEVIHL